MGQCCSSHPFEDEYPFKEFWSNMKLRSKSHKDLEEYISLRVNKGTIQDQSFFKLTDEFLLSKNKNSNLDKVLKSFWRDNWLNAAAEGKTYELLVSLFFLATKNKNNFANELRSMIEDNLEYKKIASNKTIIKSILKYYFYLVSNFCYTSIISLEMITTEDANRVLEMFQDQYIEKLVYTLTYNLTEDSDIVEFFKSNYELLCDDSKIREEIKKNYQEINNINPIPKRV